MAVTVLSGIAPAGLGAEIAGNGVPLVVGATSANNIDFNVTPTTAGFDRRASMHPVSGTGNVNTVTLGIGRRVSATLTSVMTFVHSVGVLECPGFEPILGAIGDVVTFFKDPTAPNAVKIIDYQRKDGSAIKDASQVAGAATIYMANAYSGLQSGNDANDGLTALTPVLTVARALFLLREEGGEIVLAPGAYQDPASKIIFDVASLKGRLTITGWAQTPARIYLGEKKTVFTADQNGVWKCVITTVIPAFVATYGGVQWVWEEGTPELPITTATAHPLQKQRRQSGGTAYAFEHKRMLRVGTGVPAQIAANLTTLRINNGASNGKWVYDATNLTLYFRRYDNLDPNTTGTGIWIPSQTEGVSLVTGGTGEQKVTVQGVEVYFGYYGFDMENLTSFTLENCRAFGNAYSGVSGKQSNYSEELQCQYLGNGTDGSDSVGPSTQQDDQISNQTKWYNIWACGNGDQGLSGHGGTENLIIGGLLENNGNGGCLGFGHTTCIGVTTRNNITCGFASLGAAAIGDIQMNMQCIDCHSYGDEYGYTATGQGLGAGASKILVRGGSVRNATVAAYRAQPGSTIEVLGVMTDGNATDIIEDDGTSVVTIEPCTIAGLT